jgi:heme o synthase
MKIVYSEHSVAKILSNSKNWNISDVVRLFKFRLSLTVALSSVLSYLIVSTEGVQWFDLIMLFIGGLLTSFSASGINQILEKDYDILMKRTSNRPVASGIMTPKDGLAISIACGLIGVIFLAAINELTAFLSMFSLILYAFVYTPLKRHSAISVFIGAIPGAIPVVIGSTAAGDNLLGIWSLSLFAFQFVWQLPHFWAIAWLANEDYAKAGFRLLPTFDNTLSSKVGLYAALASICILPIVWIPYMFLKVGIVSTCLISVLTLFLVYLSFQLSVNCDRKYALRLMLMSIAYLPLSLVLFLIDKI